MLGSIDVLFSWPAACACFALGRDLPEVCRAALRGLAATFRAESSCGGNLQKVIRQLKRRGKKFISSPRTLFGKNDRAENIVGFANHVAKSFEIVFLTWHEQTLAP